jgi:hypothetical protein
MAATQLRDRRVLSLPWPASSPLLPARPPLPGHVPARRPAPCAAPLRVRPRRAERREVPTRKLSVGCARSPLLAAPWISWPPLLPPLSLLGLCSELSPAHLPAPSPAFSPWTRALCLPCRARFHRAAPGRSSFLSLLWRAPLLLLAGCTPSPASRPSLLTRAQLISMATARRCSLVLGSRLAKLPLQRSSSPHLLSGPCSTAFPCVLPSIARLCSVPCLSLVFFPARAFRCSYACYREAPCSVLLRRIVVRAKLLAVDIESVTRVLDTVKRCVCFCLSLPGRDLALLLAACSPSIVCCTLALVLAVGPC